MQLFKRASRFLVSTAILSSAFLMTAAAAHSQTGVVTSPTLRLRSEPSTKAEIVALTTKGSSLSIVGKDGDWYQVTYQNKEGYVRKASVALVETDADTEQDTDSNAHSSNTKESARRTSDLYALIEPGTPSLNVYSGPGATYTLNTTVRGGTILPLLSARAGWCEVDCDGSVGYVNGDYIQVMTTEEMEDYQESTEAKAVTIVETAQDYLGCPYVYGANGPSSFDCSGFTSYLYHLFGYEINRTASTQLDNGVPVEKDELQAGDLVFFRYNTEYPASHVGIYIGDGDFIHASTNTNCIKIDTLESGHFASVYTAARRILS